MSASPESSISATCLGVPLVQVQRDLGKERAKIPHHVRQGVARLRMRGRHRQAPVAARDEILARAAQVFGLEQHALDDRQQRRPGRGQPGEALAGAGKDLHPEFLLQLANLPAHARLRGVQHGGDFRQVEAAAHGLADGA
jgi:hypothetical protein